MNQTELCPAPGARGSSTRERTCRCSRSSSSASPTVSRIAPRPPKPTAASIAPGSEEPAARAQREAERDEPETREAEAEKDRSRGLAARTGVARIVREHEKPRDLVARRRRRARAEDSFLPDRPSPTRTRETEAGRRQHAADDEEQRHREPVCIGRRREARPLRSRSRERRARPPRSARRRGRRRGGAQADAAITLFRAIQAKFVTYRRSETSAAPRMPSAARHATTEGTPRRGPRGASAATSPEPRTVPPATRRSASLRPNAGTRVAPVWSVVATMFAPAKMRKRSTGDCVFSESGTGPRSAACISDNSGADLGGR